MVSPIGWTETCSLCGEKTVCRMEIADRTLALCPECIAILTADDEAAALASTFLAVPDIPTIH